MSISFGGVGSGLPVNDWIDALVQVERQSVNRLYTQQTSTNSAKSTLNTIESKFSSLRSSLEKITDSNIISAFDIFDRKKVSSSDADIATATVSNKAAVQNLTLKVNALATSSKAASINNPGDVATGDTTVADLGGNTSTSEDVSGLFFSLYVNNEKHEFTLAKDGSTTMTEVMDMINTEFSGGEITASLTSGKLKLDVNNGSVTDFRMGSSTDTSNFLNITHLTRTALVEGETTPDNIDYVESNNTLTKLDINAALVGNAANLTTEVTAGTFTVGNAEFTIDADTTLADLIAKINYEEDSGVSASFDEIQNKLILSAKDPGALTINVEKGTSNFTDVMGLTNGNAIATGSQTLGSNALVELNGNVIEASSNTLSSDFTGIDGLTINLLNTTSEDEGETSEVTLNIDKDNDELTNSIDSFLKKFNEIVNEVDKQTASTGKLKGEYSLIRLKDDLRSSVTSMISGLDEYNNLAMVGITSGSVGTDVEASTNTLSLDKAKLIEALNENPDDVRALLIGDSERGITGIMQTLEEKVESALDVEYGYFSAREQSYESSSSIISNNISNAEDRLEKYRERLVQQFSAMDQAISEMKSQSSGLF